jgi:hypothetical protein
VLIVDPAQAFGQQIHPFFPIVKGLKGPAQPVARSRQRYAFGCCKALHKSDAPGAQAPPADGMALIALYIDNAFIFQMGQQSAPNRAFLANGGDDPVMFFARTRPASQRYGFEHAYSDFFLRIESQLVVCVVRKRQVFRRSS